jgi:hypothetical protein
MAQIDLNDVIKRAVSDEVNRVMSPYTDVLRRLASAFGTGLPQPAAGRGPGRGAGAAKKARRSAGRPRKNTVKVGKGDASKFEVGQGVRYKQGRGEFTATVVARDTETHMLTVRREKDGKEVQRPASKVY